MQIALDELKEEHLQALLGTAENFRIEFKSELDLATPALRLEAAKDISALANSAGGRIFYGICERKSPDGLRRAESLSPLVDRSLQARLEDVVADTVHPQPHWRVVSIEVEGGFVLVAEVYPEMEPAESRRIGCFKGRSALFVARHPLLGWNLSDQSVVAACPKALTRSQGPPVLRFLHR